jgi:hypothetical protein
MITKIECSGRVATVEAALASPSDFALELSFLGYTLSYIGDSISTMVSKEDGEKVRVAMLKDIENRSL